MNDDDLLKHLTSLARTESKPAGMAHWRDSLQAHPRRWALGPILGLASGVAAVAVVLVGVQVGNHTPHSSPGGNHPAVGVTASATTKGSTSGSPLASPSSTATSTTGTAGSHPQSQSAPGQVVAGIVTGWGDNSDGALGNGLQTNSASPVPMQLPAGSHVAQIVEGDGASVAVLSDGTVWVTGRTYDGELGNGTYPVSVDVPTKVAITNVKSVSAGQFTLFALKNDGTVWSWGWNGYGALGTGSSASKTATPAEVPGLSNVVQVTAQWTTGVALKSDGTVWSWGDNAAGNLGNGTQCSPSTGCQGSGTPVQVHGAGNVGFLSGVASISSGRGDTLAVLTSGTVVGWGADNYGQLGDNDNKNKPAPVAMLASGGGQTLGGVASVAAGGTFTLVLKGDGTVLAAGYNLDGELGNGTSGSSVYVPVAVSGLSDVKAVAAGYYHALALRSDGTVWAWGKNDAGQLGTGSAGGFRSSAAMVGGLSGQTAIAAGGSTSLALS